MFKRLFVAFLVVLGVVTTAGQAVADPIAPPLPDAVPSRPWTVPDYIAAWEAAKGRPMTGEEREHLARGCIGVTVVNLDRPDAPNPPLGLSFHSFVQAMIVREALNEIIATRPSPERYVELVRADPLLSRLKNVEKALPASIDPSELTAAVYSKRFWTRQVSTWSHDEARAAFRPDAETGQVDMSKYRYRARPGYVNFDYGWYDDETRNWWHANHAEPDMEIYQSTMRYYSRPLMDFDAQVFSVAFARKS